MSEQQASIVPIKCANCGQAGVIAWSIPLDGSVLVKSMGSLVKVSSGFHWEVGRGVADKVQIVCDQCDEIQP